MTKATEWCFEIGEKVTSNMEQEDTGLLFEEEYIVKSREKEDGEQYFTVESQSTGKMFEDVPASLLNEI